MNLKIMINKIINWFKDSNRYLHLIGGISVIIVSILLGFVIPKEIICVIIVAGCLELKDKLYGGKWDWIDFFVTVIPGIIVYVIYKIILICYS